MTVLNEHENSYRNAKCRSIESSAKMRAMKWNAVASDWPDHLTLSESRYLLECASVGIGGLLNDMDRLVQVRRQVALIDAKTDAACG